MGIFSKNFIISFVIFYANLLILISCDASSAQLQTSNAAAPIIDNGQKQDQSNALILWRSTEDTETNPLLPCSCQ